MDSRDINELLPEAKQRAELFLKHCEIASFEVLIYSTYRDFEAQAKLFRRGRSLFDIQARADELSDVFDRPDLAEILMGVGPQYGEKVTNAAPGQTVHNYRGAFDGVPLMDGEPHWGNALPADQARWKKYGLLVEVSGFEWGGNWISFKDLPHAQLPGVRWQDLIREGSA